MRQLFGLALITIICAASSPAAAQDDDPAAERLRLAPFVSAGFGGQVDLELTAYGSTVGEDDDDLDPTFGFGIVADYAVARYFALGLLTRASFWQSETYIEDRVGALDASVLLRGRYPFEHGEVYLAVPVGVSFSWLGEFDVFDVEGQFDMGVGWNVGVMAGGQVLVTDDLGLFVQLGGVFRGASQDGTATTGGEGELRFFFRQFTLEVGMSILL